MLCIFEGGSGFRLRVNCIETQIRSHAFSPLARAFMADDRFPSLEWCTRLSSWCLVPPLAGLTSTNSWRSVLSNGSGAFPDMESLKDFGLCGSRNNQASPPQPMGVRGGHFPVFKIEGDLAMVQMQEMLEAIRVHRALALVLRVFLFDEQLENNSQQYLACSPASSNNILFLEGSGTFAHSLEQSAKVHYRVTQCQ